MPDIERSSIENKKKRKEEGEEICSFIITLKGNKKPVE